MALVTKKLWAILDFFFTQTELFTARKVTVSVSKIRVLGQKKLDGGEHQMTPPPPPACLGLKLTLILCNIKISGIIKNFEIRKDRMQY